MDVLQTIDADALVAINNLNSPYFDNFMWMVSSKLSWLLMIVVLLTAVARCGWRKTLIFVGALAIAVLLADQIASGIIKNLVQRPRPTHAPALEGLLHIVRDYRGGMYGFVSSHAANSVAAGALLCLAARSRHLWGAMTLWTLLQVYSRMYLGVHYPGDIIGGALVGVVVAVAVYRLWSYMMKRYAGDLSFVSQRDSLMVSLSVYVTVFIIAILSIII